MAEYLAGAGISSEGMLGHKGEGRRPYVKPFVRNLDVLDTESKTAVFSIERTFLTTGKVEGPS